MKSNFIADTLLERVIKQFPDKFNMEYSKKSLWQWILIYLVIGAIAYGLVYYFVLADKDNGSNNNSVPEQQNNQPNLPGY